MNNEQSQIIQILKNISQENNIKILYAIESGSRAWGFASVDSDYDVRFIYARPLEWYLSIEEGKRDTIECPLIEDKYDINGWDIKKALKLFAKSNPPFFEWLNSPIIYIEDKEFVAELKILRKEYFSPKSMIYHYLSMAKGNYNEYISNRDELKLKKYFYVLRPLLACKWIELKNEYPPVEFVSLLDLIDDKQFLDEILKLLEKKLNSNELDKGKKIEIINKNIEEMLEYYNLYANSLKEERKINIEKLDKVFRKYIKF